MALDLACRHFFDGMFRILREDEGHRSKPPQFAAVSFSLDNWEARTENSAP
jgi:hypothetical protein